MGFIFGAMNAIGGEKAILEVIQDRLKEGSPGDRRIYRHKTPTLLRYIRILYFLPVFDMERPIELDDYKGKTLGAIISLDGRHVRYRTADRFLRELASLGAGDDMSLSLAGYYYKAFYGVEMPVYVDGHFKAVWTLKNIPEGKHGMMDRVMPGLKQVFLNGQRGHPLLHRTCPGDRHLTKELLPIVRDFEDAVGREVVNVVVFDGEGCSLEVFKAFDRLNTGREKRIYPLTVLDSNQYRWEDFRVKEKGRRPLEEKDFEVLRRDKKGRVKTRVALVEFDYLSNANRRRKDGEEYQVRCALVKKENGKLTAIVTTMPYGEIGSSRELANLYYNRWPCQEARFKEMTRYCNLDVNHGFKKKEVFNRTAAKRLEKVEMSLAYNVRRLENLEVEIERVRRQVTKRNAQRERALGKLEGQVERARGMLRDGRGDEGKQRARLEKKLRELGRLEGEYQEKMKVLKGRERRLGKKVEKISKSIERNREEVERWRKEREKPLYELDTEMDHVMTNFKILYENSLLCANETFFEGRVGMDMMHRQFINHYGDLEMLDGGKRLRFRLNRFDGKGLTKKARRACRIFNGMKIRTSDGILLEMAVKR
ncbi:MAG: hypothetical protein ACE5HH_02985 [Candidatus Hydrothermarchaeales archaeon]